MSAEESKIGNQEKSDGSLPYTQNSVNIPKHITSETIIDPRPGATLEDMPSSGAPPAQTIHGSDAQKLKDNPPRRHSASPQRRAVRKTGSNENSAEHSPLHHHHQTRVASKVGGMSPSSDRKVSLEGGQGIAPNTPGRSRLRVAGRPDDSPEESSVVPKLEDWDDPSAGDGFTGIFEKVSEEKQSSSTKVPMITNDSVYLNRYHHDGGSNKSSKFCCFNWGRK